MKGIAISILTILLAGILAVGGYLAVSYLGTPLGYWEAWNAANELINTEYKDTDYKIAGMGYASSSGEYVVEIKSPTKIDEYFTLRLTDSGEIKTNYYESQVEGKGNTVVRLSKQYEAYMEERGLWDEFDSNYKFRGYVSVYPSDYDVNYILHEDALSREELELNKAYEIKEFARVHGYITIEAKVEEPTFETIAEILLQVKQLADEKDVPFYTISVDLRQIDRPSRETMVKVWNFRYEDIYESDLAERAKANSDNYEKLKAVAGLGE